MIRVVHIISDSNIGGAGVLLCNLLRHTDRTRYEPSVILPRGSRLLPRLSALGVACYPVDGMNDRSFGLGAVPALTKILREIQPEILQTHAALSGRIAGRLAGVPVRIATRHCAFPPPRTLQCFPGKQLNGGFQSLLTDRFIAVADAAKDNLTETGIPADRITVILNGSDPLREVPETELSALRRRLGIPENAFVAGICARLEACKDHETFLRAAKLCLEAERYDKTKPGTSPDQTTESCPKAEQVMYFLIVGSGSKEASLRQLAARLGISDRVVFAGFAEDPAPYYRLFSVNVNCSVGTETSCLAISEGYSIGLPALVSDFGGNPAMVEDGKTGFVLPQRDAGKYAEKLLLLRDHPALYRELSRNAAERYRQKYTASGMTRALEAVYEELLAQTRIRTSTLVTKKK